MAVGPLRRQLCDRPRTVPGNVRIVGLVDQARVLPTCRLFISHAGINSVREAITFGRPMLVTPQLGDQFHNARRCRRLGLARELDLRATTHSVAESIAAALDDPGLRQAAAAQQRALVGMPSARDIGAVCTEAVTAP